MCIDLRLPWLRLWPLLGACAHWALGALSAYGQTAPVYGILETTDGHRYQGDIELKDDGLQVVVDAENPMTIPLQDLAVFVPSTRPADEINPIVSVARRGLTGAYFATMDLTGPQRVRIDDSIDFDWREGAPFPNFPKDGFSVRWSGQIHSLTSGLHQFHATSDDGVRLWIDDQLVIDHWLNRSVGESSGLFGLAAGTIYRIKLEYFEQTGQASVRLLWTPPAREKELVPPDVLTSGEIPVVAKETNPPPAQGWTALYFSSQDLRGPFRSVTNSAIDFDWKNREPLTGLEKDHFSVRWMGELQVPETDRYTFHVENDDGFRLWIDGEAILDHWRDGVLNLSTEPIELFNDRTYVVRYEMFDNTVDAKARLFWSSSTMAKSILPSRYVRPVPVSLSVQEPVDPATHPPGVLMTDGSFVAQPVFALEGNLIRFSRFATDPTLSMATVARIHFQEVSRDDLASLESGRSGLLLKTGDFLDGELRKIQNRRATLNSVLLGLKTFRINEVLVAVMRDPSPRPAKWEIRSKDRSVYRADQIDLRNNRVEFRDGALLGWYEPADNIAEIRRVTGVAP